MANEHFFPGEYFSSGLSAPFLGASYAPPPRSGGLDSAAAMAFGLPWGDHQQLPADSSATTAHFDSALSSLVSSPASAAAVAGGGLAHGDGAGGDHDVAIGDLIGRLGSICNGASANDSCYSTPLSSPPRGATPAFRGYAAALETGRLSRVSSSKSLGCAAPAAMALENSEPEMSPRAAGNHAMPDPPPAKGAGSARKRKAPAKGKVKTEPSLPATAATNASPKRPKVAGDENASATAEEEKPELEPAKDYIHVRARRGQATDSHSLAERVRRERISERMKLLQSLVPGCNKITGKALMLDEIINYVQSLQRQVEFLSMKLSTMNPQPNFDGHYNPSKDMNQMAMSVYPSDDPATAFSYRGSPADPFALATAAHHGQELENTFQPSGGAFSLEQDLQSMVQMGATMAKIPMLSTANRRQ